MKIEGWRKFLAYTVAVGAISTIDTFRGPLSDGTLNTVENLSYAYLVGQAAVDLIKARGPK